MYLFKSIDDNLIVTNRWKTSGLIKILYRNLELKSTEIYKNNKLIEFRSDTLKKKKKTKISVINDGKDLILNGPYGSIKYPNTYLISTGWDCRILENNKIVDIHSGKLKHYTINNLGTQTLTINRTDFKVNHYKLTFNNKKKSTLDIWYNEEHKIILKFITNSHNNKKKMEHIVTKIYIL